MASPPIQFTDINVPCGAGGLAAGAIVLSGFEDVDFSAGEWSIDVMGQWDAATVPLQSSVVVAPLSADDPQPIPRLGQLEDGTLFLIDNMGRAYSAGAIAGWHLVSVAFGGASPRVWIDAEGPVALTGLSACPAHMGWPVALDSTSLGLCGPMAYEQVLVWNGDRDPATFTEVLLGQVLDAEGLVGNIDFGFMPPARLGDAQPRIELLGNVAHRRMTPCYSLGAGHDGVTCSSPDLVATTAGPFTFEAWIWPSQPERQPGSIFSIGDAPETAFGLRLLREDGEEHGWLRLQVVNDGRPLSLPATDRPYVEPSAWNHVALTYDGSTAVVYANGVRLGALELTASVPTRSTSVEIAGERNGAQPLLGSIQEVRLWTGARTQQQLLATMRELPLVDPDIRAYWSFTAFPSLGSPGDRAGDASCQNPLPAIEGAVAPSLLTESIPSVPGLDTLPLVDAIAPSGGASGAEIDEQALNRRLLAGLRSGALEVIAELLPEADRAATRERLAAARAIAAEHPGARLARDGDALVLTGAAEDRELARLRDGGITAATMMSAFAAEELLGMSLGIAGKAVLAGGASTATALNLVTGSAAAATAVTSALATGASASALTAVLGAISGIAGAVTLPLMVVGGLGLLGAFTVNRLLSGTKRKAEAVDRNAAVWDEVQRAKRSMGNDMERLSLTMFEVGHGDSLLLSYLTTQTDSDGATTDYSWKMLVDGGPSRRRFINKVLPTVSGFRRLDAVCATHADNDHAVGLLQLMAGGALLGPSVVCGRLVVPLTTTRPGGCGAPPAVGQPLALAAGTPDLTGYLTLVRLLRAAQAVGMVVTTVATATPAPRFSVSPVPNLELHVTGPWPWNVCRYWDRLALDPTQMGDTPNRTSVTFDVDSATNLSGVGLVMLCADAWDRSDQVDRAPWYGEPSPYTKTDIRGLPAYAARRVRLLKVPHHASSHTVNAAFYEAVTADHYLISASATDRHGLPSPDVLSWIVETRRAAGAPAPTLWFTNRSPGVEGWLADNPPTVAQPYTANVLVAGAPGMTFSFVNGQLVLPQVGGEIEEYTAP